ncbi:OR2A protein, partial [Pseudoatta argentina]
MYVCARTHVENGQFIKKILMIILVYRSSTEKRILKMSNLLKNIHTHTRILTLHDQLKNIRRVFENFHYIVSSILFVIKLSNEFLNHDKIRYLYKAMENHWNIFTDEFEMRILKNYSILSQKFALIYAVALYSITITYLMVPIKPILLDVILPLNESRPRFFMLSIEYKIDKDKYFVPLFFYNIIVVVTGVAILIGVDAMYVTRTIHACSLFSIIGYVHKLLNFILKFLFYSQQFEKIISQTSINMKVSKGGCYMNGMNALFKKSASEQLIYDEYIICLKKYQLALKFASVLNSMYQIVSLTSLLLCGAIISLAPLLMIYELDEFEQLLQYIVITIGTLLLLIILCYPGQKLLDESQNVFYQIYAVEWYTFSPRLKSLIIITLHRSLVPCSLRAGNLCSMSIETLAIVSSNNIKFLLAMYKTNSCIHLYLILALYDNWKNTQIVFEISYHTACIFIFIAKLWNKFWNYNKVVRMGISYFTTFLSLKN